MYRVKVKNKDLGLKVEQIDLEVTNEQEAREWVGNQLKFWGVESELLDESFEFEKLELLLDQSEG